MDIYPELTDVKSPKCETLNRSLRNLSTVLAFMGFENYTRLLEIYLAQRNLMRK